MSVRIGAGGNSARAGAIVALLALGVLVVLGFTLGGEEPVGRVDRLLSRPGSPLPGGEQVSLEDAALRFETPIYRPDYQLASDANIKQIWLRTEAEPEVYIIYENGIHLIVRPENAGQSTADFAKAQVEDGIPGEVVQLGSVDAFAVPPIAGQGPGSVRVVIPDAIFSVIGDGSFALDELLRVADSVLKRGPELRAERTNA